MARIEISGDELEVRLSPLEKLGSFRGNVRVPLASVSAVSVSRTPFRTLGAALRAPGTGVPGVVALGTYHHRAGYDIAALYARRAAVIIELTPDRPLRRLLISVKDADATVEALRAASRATVRPSPRRSPAMGGPSVAQP
jgi:hypothetical protein